MTLRMVKNCPDATHQFAWLMKLPDYMRPPNLRWHEGAEANPLNEYSYDYVEGHHPRNWLTVWRIMDIYVWCGSEHLKYSQHEYCEYMRMIMIKLCNPADAVCYEGFLDIIMKAELTPVARCHGDLTLYNVIMRKHHGMVLIDPGHCRGLPCRELDESKLMQSIDGFDVIHKGLPPACVIPKFQARKVHWALLATHYIRMLRHVQDESLAFAYNRIAQIKEMIL